MRRTVHNEVSGIKGQNALYPSGAVSWIFQGQGINAEGKTPGLGPTGSRALAIGINHHGSRSFPGGQLPGQVHGNGGLPTAALQIRYRDNLRH
jgi:hypothetical protein